MKIAASIVLASLASTTVAATKAVSAKNAAKVLRAARRLEQGQQQGDDAAQEEQYDYLANYSLKLIGCKAGEQVIDPETGDYEMNAAMFRLCPTESGCESESVAGCDSGYGDFVVGLNTFVNAYFEDQRDNMNWDDQFQVDRYSECAEYEPDNGDDDQWANYQFFIGPTCTEDELDVRLGFFTEETCTTESEDITFEQVSNGWTLPYTSGGLVSDYCSECYAMNENYEYEIREMCMQLYANAAYACEESMEYFSYYGQNVQGCEYVDEILPAAVKKADSNAGKVIGWIIFALLIVGLVGYIVWWRKSKSKHAFDYDENEQSGLSYQTMEARRQALREARRQDPSSPKRKWWQRWRRQS